MLGLSANLNYYLFNGNVDLRKGIFRLCESIREEMSLDPSDASNVYMFMSRNRKVVKILHYERGFYVLYEKRPVMGSSRNRLSKGNRTYEKAAGSKRRGEHDAGK